MKKNENDKDFDADEFIESFRASAVPTYHTADDNLQEDVVERPPEQKSKARSKPPNTTNEVEETSVADFFEDDDTDKYESLNMSSNEIEYIKAYVARNNFRQVASKGQQVMIRKKYRKIIQNIMNLLEEQPNMAVYIDNVLTQHFKQFYPTMVSIYKKCPPKF